MNGFKQTIWNGIFPFVLHGELVEPFGMQASLVRASKTPNFALRALGISILLLFQANSYALPIDGVVSAGDASISSGAASMTINQNTPSAAINWQNFNIGAGEAVNFVQPNSSSVALNRVLSADPSSIQGNLSANGQVFLVNPNGILFGQGAQVNVGGLVASTRNITDSDFMAGNYKFSGAGNGAVVNQGTINADGGYVAMLGSTVSNEGVISAKLGTVALASGEAMTLDMAGDGLLNVTVNQGAVNALVQNGGLIKADGGQVLMTAQAAGNLLQTVVNNTGVIQAQTIDNHNGVIKLLGDMQTGMVQVNGKLDASAANGLNGGFIETSAAHVKVANNAIITTQSTQGKSGTWLIDPQDFIIGGNSTDNIAGATLGAMLVTNSVVINTAPGPDATVAGTPPVTSLNTAVTGNGDIFVNEPISWTGSTSPTTLTLNAVRNVNINAAITATNGNFVVCCGNDANVNAPITTTNGSVLLAAGHNVNINAAMTTTDGNITICAGLDANINAAMTLTRGTNIPGQSLGLAAGLVLSAGNNGTGPGVAGGTVVFSPLAPPITVTGPNAPVTVNYNPVSYTEPANYLPNFTLTGGSTLTQHMLVFPGGGYKPFDGLSVAALSSLKGSPVGVSLVAGSGSTASFDTPDVGTGKTITFSGYSLGGLNASSFTLPISCCAPFVGKTTGNITAPVTPITPVVIGPTGQPIPAGTIVYVNGVPTVVGNNPYTKIVYINGVPTLITGNPYALMPSGGTGGGTFMPYFYNIGSVNSALTAAPLLASSLPSVMPNVIPANTPAQLLTLAPVLAAPIPYIPPFHPHKQERN
jgi:filamentous hemagglutinin family protein